jgi:hypothetical protein
MPESPTTQQKGTSARGVFSTPGSSFIESGLHDHQIPRNNNSFLELPGRLVALRLILNLIECLA